MRRRPSLRRSGGNLDAKRHPPSNHDSGAPDAVRASGILECTRNLFCPIKRTDLSAALAKIPESAAEKSAAPHLTLDPNEFKERGLVARLPRGTLGQLWDFKVLSGVMQWPIHRNF